MDKDKHSPGNYTNDKTRIFVKCFIICRAMNKYLIRGLGVTSFGVALCVVGLWIMERESVFYKWLLVVGVIAFGIGFLTIVYSFIRKIERRSLLDDRKERQTKNE